MQFAKHVEGKRAGSFFKKIDIYPNKYIKKMRYLEKHYRNTHVYTDYHKQLETPYLLDQEPVVATLIEPSAPPDSNEL